MNLSDAIQAYNQYREHAGIAPGTLRTERRILNYLLADIGNVATTSLRPQHLDVYWSKRNTWSAGTMNHAASVLGTFFKWCQNRGYIRRDMELLAGRRRMRVPPRDRIIIPQQEFETFLSNIKDPRSRVAAAIGLYLFTRISETEALRWQDLDTYNGRAEVFRKKTQTIDTLPLCSELIEELERWRFAYGAAVGEPPQPGWFVVPGLTTARRYGTPGTKGFTRSGEVSLRPTVRASLGGAIRTVLEDAGYYRRMEGGHTLRRSGAVALYDQLTSVGHDRAIRLCQAMLGHANISTTEVYLRLDLDRKLRNDLLSAKRMFPGEGGATVVSLAYEDGAENGEEGGRSLRM